MTLKHILCTYILYRKRGGSFIECIKFNETDFVLGARAQRLRLRDRLNFGLEG